MAKLDIEFDASEFIQGATRLTEQVKKRSQKAVRNIASEVLRLSQSEVPHNIGTLQNSGHVEDKADESLVGYGGSAAPYAARLHEHREYNFQKGRKGKYLEDPIKNNLTEFRKYYKDLVTK